MAYDKLVDSAVLDDYFTDIGNAIRRKNGETSKYTPSQMPSAIDAIVQTKSGTVTMASNYNYLRLGFRPDVLIFHGYSNVEDDGTYSYYNGVVSFIVDYSAYWHIAYFYDENLAWCRLFAYNYETNGEEVVGVYVQSQSDDTWEGYNGTLSYTAYKFT